MRVFVSYARSETADFAEQLFTCLQQHASELWIDEADRDRDTWWSAITDAIEHCDVFIVAITSLSTASSYCRIEWEYALQLEKPVIPVFLERVPFPPGLPHFRFFDLTLDPEEQIIELLHHIRWAVQSNDRRVHLLHLLDTDWEDDTHAVPPPKTSDPTPLHVLHRRTDCRAVHSPRRMHIMTSAKGGTGKTLLALALLRYFTTRANQDNALVVDMNHYGQSIFKGLSNARNLYPAPEDWCCTAIREGTHGKVITHERTKIRSIGYENFWHQLRDILKFPMYHDHDVIVDTNLDITNLCFEPPGGIRPNNAYQDFIQHNQCLQIYIWFIWSAGVIANADDVAWSIELMYRLIHKADHHRITYIHVLNPYALDATRLDRDMLRQAKTLRYRNQHDDVQTRLEVTRTWLSRQGSGTPGADTPPDFGEAVNILGTISSEIGDLLDQLENRRAHTYIYQSLRQLLYQEPVMKNLITVSELQTCITDAVSHTTGRLGFEAIMKNMYEHIFRGRGRPYNLFPMSTYDSRLTELTLDTPLQSLWNTLCTLEDDVAKFMDDLTSVEAQALK